jgi:hypothetical protein
MRRGDEVKWEKGWDGRGLAQVRRVFLARLYCMFSSHCTG